MNVGTGAEGQGRFVRLLDPAATASSCGSRGAPAQWVVSAGANCRALLGTANGCCSRMATNPVCQIGPRAEVVVWTLRG